MGSIGRFQAKVVRGTGLLSKAERLERIPDETVFLIPNVHAVIGSELPEKEAFFYFCASGYVSN